ncbi:MAG: radical SAM protein [Clostridiales bacterium]|nr:radical SAM protein [Candidatus Scatonaster coprocaballi]
MSDQLGDGMNRFSLETAVWEITLACCFSCKYCGSQGGQARENELTTKECLDVVHQLAKLGCRRVSLIGGEVFMRRDWKTIVRELTDYGIRTAIITNGFLFSEETIRDLKEVAIESIAVSLDSVETVHDRYRQKGSYARAVQAIDALTEAGFTVTVISTLNKESVTHLDDFYAFLRTRPIAAWQLQACSPMGNAARSGIDYRFDFREVITFVEQNMEAAPFAMGIADNIGYYTENEGKLRGHENSWYRGCQAGLTLLGIDSIGNIRGCESMYDDRFIEGNIRQRRIADIWNDPSAFAYNRKFRRENLTGACATCEYGPYCAGGCRSYNFFVHGKIYESPACARKC